MMVIVALAAVLLGAIVSIVHNPPGIWIVQRAVPMHFEIVDDATRQPIAGASVTVYDVRGGRASTKGVTDQDGFITLSHRFDVVGTQFLFGFRDAGRIDVSFWCLQVEAHGYRDRRTELWRRIDDGGNLVSPDRIELFRETSTPPASDHTAAGQMPVPGH